ncbi:putative defense protein [Hetaerina americana]|uniref:putative defense protein n=1 Tax=Hetaerina americana TaxID=62018 RepID=UPI003A7F4904
MRFLLVLGVALCCFFAASAFSTAHRPGKLNPNHVPSSACVDMVPVHNDSVASSDPAPYVLTPSVSQANPGDVIQVVTSGINGAKFKGLYMQARVVGAGVDAVGKFMQENEERSPAVRISSCPPGEKNAVSYISRTGIETITIDWRVPENLPEGMHNVYFRATFLESFSRFWVNVDSEPIFISSDGHQKH